MARLRIGSRGSQLALWQSNHVADQLRARGHEVSIEVVRTTGDRVLDVALSKVGAKGLFTREIEDALAEHRVDLAVHSLKDMPTELDPRFVLAAITRREDPRDAFVSVRHASLAALPRGARVGTSSLRRQAQLLALRPDLDVHPLRGNVDTRLRRLDEGHHDAIVLAAAGLRRLGRTEHVREELSPETMCPAAGQGALAIETRADDPATASCLAFLDDADARFTTGCERTALNALGGGCQIPIGAFAERQGSAYRLAVVVARPDGSELLREQGCGTDALELGGRVARAMLDRGAGRILDSLHRAHALAPQQP